MGMLKEAYSEQDSEGSKYGFGRWEWLLDAHEGQKMATTDFGLTIPIPSPRAVLLESMYRTWTARLSDFMIFPSFPRNSWNLRACS